MTITKLKGGSLNTTCLHQTSLCNFVRKSVALYENREYGYVRWYSQLKKLQRYDAMFPGLFPVIFNVNYTQDTAYFDMEYMDGLTDIKTLLCSNLDKAVIDKMVTSLFTALDYLHNNSYNTASNISSLYFKEEVEQKIHDALLTSEFMEFYNLDTFIYNGVKVSGINKYLNRLKEFFATINLETEEYTHGNPTLENIMYSVAEDRIVFIDLYEESIIDSKNLDYAQILQCSHSNYGFINDNVVSINGNIVSHSLTIPPNFDTFNTAFIVELQSRNVNMQLIDILEATQFIRMLPFKCMAGEIDKAKFFYVHACSLLTKIFPDD